MKKRYVRKDKRDRICIHTRIYEARVYKLVYSDEACRYRKVRFKRQGVPYCPNCGSEALRQGMDESAVCLRCGKIFYIHF